MYGGYFLKLNIKHGNSIFLSVKTNINFIPPVFRGKTPC